MRLLLDEMYSPRLAEHLRARGHDVLAVAELAELIGRSDIEVARFARERGRMVVTENVADFWRLDTGHHSGSPVGLRAAGLAGPKICRDWSEPWLPGWTPGPRMQTSRSRMPGWSTGSRSLVEGPRQQASAVPWKTWSRCQATCRSAGRGVPGRGRSRRPCRSYRDQRPTDLVEQLRTVTQRRLQ